MITQKARDLRQVLGKKLALELRIQEAEAELGRMIKEVDLYDMACLLPGVEARKVWGNDTLSIALLVNKSAMSGCGILLWGAQFENGINPIACMVSGLEARFMVFDGQAGSNDFAVLRGIGPEETKNLFEGLRRVCAQVGVNYVFIKNAELLMAREKIAPGKEFREITEFYMKIARRDGSVIPEFAFIDPQRSFVFWDKNG